MKSLFGYGYTIRAIAKSGGWNIYDDKFDEIKIDEYKNTLYPSKYFDENKSILEITTPGIPPHNPLIKKAKNLISEYDYFYEKMPFSIWISGTNGKTTTTQMSEYLLKKFDIDVGGNIGKPLAEMRDSDIWILETSSFTLHYTKKAKPNIYVLLPIKPDHISWHGSFEEYESAKLSPLDKMTERDIAIIPKKYQNYNTSAFKIVYEDENDLIDYFEFKDLYFESPFLLDEVLAKSIRYILDFEEGSLNGFRVDSHKLEEFFDSKGRLWVDDSKATNIDATINALKRYKDKKIYLILGGDSKGQDLKELFDELKNYDVELFLIGKDANKFVSYANGFRFCVCNTLENAIKAIDKQYKNGVALLSPASASLDQFKSYKHRGEEFKKIIYKL